MDSSIVSDTPPHIYEGSCSANCISLLFVGGVSYRYDCGSSTGNQWKRPLSLLIVGVALLVDPILGFSQLLPDGAFSLILGIVLLAGGVFLYSSKTGTNS